MVQYIPGPESLLAPAAAQITEGVLNFLNPHRQFQQAVQAALAQNPEIGQHFANLEASSPGLLSSLGIGKLASIPATPEKQFEIRNREAIIGGKEAQLGAETAKALYSSDQIQKALALFQQDPNIGMDAALKFATGQTTSERAVSQLQGQQAMAGQRMMQNPEINAQAGYQAATGMTPGQGAKDQFTSETINQAQEMLQNGPEVTIQKFLANEYTPKQLLGIFGTPLGDALKQQLDFLNDRYRIAIMSGRGDDAMERLKLAQAFKLYTELNDPNVSMGDIMRLLSDPDAARAARDTANVAPGDSGLVAAAKGLQQLNSGAASKVIANLDRDLTANLIQYRTSLGKSSPLVGKSGDEARELMVKTIDNILAQKAAITGQRYTASFEDVVRNRFTGTQRKEESILVPDTKRKELVFRGPDGKIVNEDAALGTPLATKDQQSTGIPPLPIGTLQSFKQAYNQVPTEGEKQALLARWKAEAPPEHYQQILDALGIKPETKK